MKINNLANTCEAMCVESRAIESRRHLAPPARLPTAACISKRVGRFLRKKPTRQGWAARRRASVEGRQNQAASEAHSLL